MSKKAKMKCDCGCGREDYFPRLKTLEIEYALDESLKQTRIGQRYYVCAGCYEPFIQELQARRLLDGYVQRMVNAKWRWYQRLWRVRRIIRMQYVMLIRNKGIEFTRKASMRSGILFVCSPRVSNILWIYWRWADTHNLRWRWKLCRHPFKTLARSWTYITGTTDPQFRACSRLLSRLRGVLPASRLSVVPHPECCRTAGPQK